MTDHEAVKLLTRIKCGIMITEDEWTHLRAFAESPCHGCLDQCAPDATPKDCKPAPAEEKPAHGLSVEAIYRQMIKTTTCCNCNDDTRKCAEVAFSLLEKEGER